MDFGNAEQYPALKADSGGDGTATWQEFGYQLREYPRLTATASGTQASLKWNAITTTHWTPEPSVTYSLYRDGEKMTGYDDSSTAYTDEGLTSGKAYTYQVAALLNGIEAGRSNEVSVTPSPPPSFGDARLYDYYWHQNQHNGRLDLPKATGGAPPLTYTVSPDMPPGLVFDSGYLTIDGKPTEAQERVHYAYTVTDANGKTASLSFSILVAPNPTASVPEPVKSDRAALTALYEAMGGEKWTNNDNWLSERPLNQWYGVTVNDQGKVSRLSLRNNNLSGELPAQLGKLEHLEVLSLDRNSLSGSLPIELGDLSNLTRLAMNRNSLSGEIPSELGNLTSLSIIGLARNQLSGALPSSLGNLTGLTRLSLHDNTGLSGPLPPGFTSMGSLQRLAIANTGLCAPDGEAFSDWLDTVDDVTPDPVPTCASP